MSKTLERLVSSSAVDEVEEERCHSCFVQRLRHHVVARAEATRSAAMGKQDHSPRTIRNS